MGTLSLSFTPHQSAHSKAGSEVVIKRCKLNVISKGSSSSLHGKQLSRKLSSRRPAYPVKHQSTVVEI